MGHKLNLDFAVFGFIPVIAIKYAVKVLSQALINDGRTLVYIPEVECMDGAILLQEKRI